MVPFLLKDDLSFNLRADCGTVRFGLTEQYTNEYLEGFSLDECIPFEFGLGIDVRPRWREHQLSEVLNRPLCIVVELCGAVLHAISGTACPAFCMVGRSFSDPQVM